MKKFGCDFRRNTLPAELSSPAENHSKRERNAVYFHGRRIIRSGGMRATREAGEFCEISSARAAQGDERAGSSRK